VSAIPPNPKRESQKNLEVTRAYGVEDAENRISWPSLFVVGRDGNVSWRSIAQTYKVRAAPAQILQALDALPPTAD
jgi:alkyl hydroperoxide reductase subunit AhpC